MPKNLMPKASLQIPELPKGCQWSVSPQAFERWNPNLKVVSAAAAGVSTISIFERIGADWTGEGFTDKKMAAILRSIGAEKDVEVHINSIGGNLFQGVSIYNILREHKGNVTIKVLGLAASAASLVAMGGDEIQIARSGFLMIHNAWIDTEGVNRHDLRDAADMLEQIDQAMADIYTARTSLERAAVHKKMDADTWINGTAAIDEGWADALLPADQVIESRAATAPRASAYAIQSSLCKTGMSRSEARNLLQDYKSGTLRAAGTGTPRATESTPCAAEVSEVMALIKSLSPAN